MISSGGLRMPRDDVMVFHVNTCSYYAKGSADYVGIWDFDEFFLPRGKYKNIPDVLNAMGDPKGVMPYYHSQGSDPERMRLTWNGGRGLADGNAHPFCFLLLDSEVMLAPDKPVGSFSGDQSWLGVTFAHGSEQAGHFMGFHKSIHPTRTVFQVGLHVAGSCRLPPQWNGCHNNTDFCYMGYKPNDRLKRSSIDNFDSNFSLDHAFDEVVETHDAKQIDAKSEAVILHHMHRRLHMKASKTALAQAGEYATSHFPLVYEELDRRGLIMPIELPESDLDSHSNLLADWIPLSEIHQKIDSAVNRSRVGSSVQSVSLDPVNLGTPLSTINLQDLLPRTVLSLNTGQLTTNRNLSPSDGSSAEGSTDTEHTSEAAVSTSSLPSFSEDASELFLASLIERTDDSWDLHLLNFLVTHTTLEPETAKTNVQNVYNSKATLTQWSKAIMAFKGTQYSSNGIRVGPKFYCKISHASGEAFYTVEGKWSANT